jgi:NAD(P)H-hydrate epimerase
LRPLVRVVTGAEAAALDAATIAAGVPSRALMQRAGAAAAAEITSRFAGLLPRGVLVLAGPGNNGGDGWVIARALASAGVEANVWSPAQSRSAACVAERDLARARAREVSQYSGEGIVVDALLGTGASGPPRGEIANALAALPLARRRGAAVVAVDVPSGVDATSGKGGVAAADLTLTFDSIKRAHLLDRDLCGEVVALDIGLQVVEPDARDLRLVDGEWVREQLPVISADAHKGTRKKLVFQGGGPGMGGAAILGLKAALASGIGMVKARVHSSNADAVHAAVPAALVEPWSDDDTIDPWADVLVIGPGLGSGKETRVAVERAIHRQNGPVLLDADALTAFAGEPTTLRGMLGGRPALLTPHPGEFARLMGVDPLVVLEKRFDIAGKLAEASGATVLLKGVPTVITSPDGKRLVVAEGTPALATGGSGDVLSGIAGTLLAQMSDPLMAAACAAWIHGRAARLAGASVRGTTLEGVLEMLPNAWRIGHHPPRYPVIAELPAVPK